MIAFVKRALLALFSYPPGLYSYRMSWLVSQGVFRKSKAEIGQGNGKLLANPVTYVETTKTLRDLINAQF
jgi:hypothetical protein